MGNFFGRGVFGIFLLFLVSPVLAAGKDVVLSVDDEAVTADEILYLLGVQSGGGDDVAALLAKQMSSKKRDVFLERVARAILFSKGAILRGLHLDPGVAARIRWDRINALAGAYVGSMSHLLSFDERVLKTHYELHRQKYRQEEQVRVRHIFTTDQEHARSAILRLLAGDDFAEVASSFSVDFVTAGKGGEMGWIERGTLPEQLEEAVFSAPLNAVRGPLTTRYGHHVFEVVERREPRLLSFEEARERVRSELVESVMASEAASLGARFPVRIEPSLLEEALMR